MFVFAKRKKNARKKMRVPQKLVFLIRLSRFSADFKRWVFQCDEI